MRSGVIGSLLFALSLVVNQPGLAAITAGIADTKGKTATTTSTNQAVNPATAACDWTPVMILPVTTPRLFKGSDGKWNLVYELLLLNYNSKESKILSLDITDSKNALVKGYNPTNMGRFMTNLNGPKTPGVLPAGGSAVVWVNLEFPSKEIAPKVLNHKLSTQAEFGGKVRNFDNNSYQVKVEEKGAVVVGPPLKGGRWFVSGGYAGNEGHRRALFPLTNRLVNAQRYAIDWLLMTEDDHVLKGDEKLSTSFVGYGKPILAVANGTVCGVVDHFKDQVPGLATGDDRVLSPGGNTIVVDIGNGNYAFYAHLKPGSIKVKEGQKVSKGEQIAELGNAGNSTAPHLHFHVMDGPSILGSRGVPYAFESFEIKGEATDLNKVEKALETNAKAPVSKSKFDGKHSEELPREGVLVVFPE
ncbi:MAG: M23 family metallopeptidase [Leptolyngbya sp.]|nr:M23 family metallopeptidase [Candidatus Melainabacteria bacterium]